MPFRSKAWFGAAILLSLGLGAAATTSYVIPGFPMSFQSQSFWCWAAADNMVLTRFNITHRQCNSADNAASQPTCGIPGGCCDNSPACNLGCMPRFRSLGLNADQAGSISSADYKGEINRNQPIVFVWNWATGGSHVMVGKGYFRYGGYDWVLANDPLRGEVSYPFYEFTDRVNPLWHNLRR